MRRTAEKRSAARLPPQWQARQAAEAIGALRDMVAPAAVGPALERACDVGRALAGAGHALACGAAAPERTAAPSTLH